jgi:GTP cyclohydrolase II
MKRRSPAPKPKSAAKTARIIARANLPTAFGKFTILGLQGADPEDTAAAMLHGRIGKNSAPLVRIHSQCLTGDVLASQRCDCRAQLEFSLGAIARARSGILLYLPQEGRGIGLMNKLRAYELQDRGRDTVEANRDLGFEADSRDYSFSAAALKALGLRKVRLLSNNPDKVSQLEEAGIRVLERIPCQPKVSRHTRRYLKTKRDKMGHLLDAL